MSKNVFFLLIVLLLGQQVSAQRSIFTVYSSTQMPFFLVINGVQINPQPVSNLRVSGMPPGRYQMRIVFANHMNPQLDMVQDIRANREITYAVAQNQFGQVNPIFVSEISNNFAPPQPQMLSSAVYNGPPPSPIPAEQPISADQPTVIHHQPNPPTTVQVVPQPPVYNPVPNYNGPVGCDNPMTPEQFRDAQNSIESKAFASSKMTLAKQIVRANCFTANQVRTLVGLFTYESDKLEFAKFAYPYTYDQGNYFRVNDAFEFESSIGKLDQFINGR